MPELQAPTGLVAAHEARHLQQAPKTINPRTFSASPYAELAPSLADIPEIVGWHKERYRRAAPYTLLRNVMQPSPLSALTGAAVGSQLAKTPTLNVPLTTPSGYQLDPEWMYRMAERYGLSRDRTMSELLATPEGQAWLRTVTTPR
jgi:hypothetical protein